MTGLRKVAVCYPWSPPFMFAAFTESALNIETPSGCEMKWIRGDGWCHSRRRTDCCEKAIEWGADLICSLDADQVYEPDIVSRFVARHDEGCEVIAAMVPMRGYVEGSGIMPFERLAWNLNFDARGHQIETTAVDPNDGDLQCVSMPTTAAMLFSRDLLEKLPRPWYFEKYDGRTWKRTEAEDSRFMLRLTKETGAKAFVDTTIRVKHCHVFEIDETFAGRFADWAEPGVGEAAICHYEEK